MIVTQLRLAARDLSRQRAFYADSLDLPVTDRTSQSFSVRAGTTELVFEASPKARGVYHVAFNIPENQLSDAKRWLVGRAALLTEDGEDEFESESWNAQMVYFRDADGNILELIAPHDLPSATERPFSSQDVLGVSEVGFPTHSVGEGARWLREVLGLEAFREPSSTFAPAGDMRGRFIVVPVGRPWFPTADRASVLPLKIEIEGAREGVFTAPGLPYRIKSKLTRRLAD